MLNKVLLKITQEFFVEMLKKCPFWMLIFISVFQFCFAIDQKHHEQRLIYSGKLLQDHLTLKEILRQVCYRRLLWVFFTK